MYRSGTIARVQDGPVGLNGGQKSPGAILKSFHDCVSIVSPGYGNVKERQLPGVSEVFVLEARPFKTSFQSLINRRDTRRAPGDRDDSCP